MKQYRLFLFAFVALSVALVGIFFPEFGAEALTFLGLGAGATGGVMLGALQTGPVTVKDADALSYEHLKRYVSQSIAQRRPAKTPLMTIMNQIRKAEQVDNEKVNYEENTFRPWVDEKDGLYTKATDVSVAIAVDNGAMWGVDDLMRCGGVPAGDGSGNDQMLIVTAVSGNNVTVQTINGDGNNYIETIPDTTKLYRAGNSKDELDAQDDVIYTLPESYFNYTQREMCQLEQSAIEARYKTYSGFNFQDKREQAIFDFKSKLEANSIFGIRSKTTIGTDVHYTSDGVYWKISNNITFGTGSGAVDPSLADILNLGEAVFPSQAGSETRVMLAGKKVLTGLAKIDKYSRDISYNTKEVYHGVKCTLLVTPFGDIKVIHSHTMDAQGKSDEAIVLDPEFVTKHEFIPMTPTQLDLKKSGVRNVINAMTIEESSCLTLRYAGSGGVHALWKPL